MIVQIIISVIITVFLSIIFAIIGSFIIYKINNNKSISLEESIEALNLPIASFVVEGVKLNFLIDSGSTGSVINKDILHSMKDIKIYNGAQAFGLEGNIQDIYCCILNIQYKKNIIPTIFNIIDMNKAFNEIEKESGYKIHGILGINFLKNNKYIIDLDKLKLIKNNIY